MELDSTLKQAVFALSVAKGCSHKILSACQMKSNVTHNATIRNATIHVIGVGCCQVLSETLVLPSEYPRPKKRRAASCIRISMLCPKNGRTASSIRIPMSQKAKRCFFYQNTHVPKKRRADSSIRISMLCPKKRRAASTIRVYMSCPKKRRAASSLRVSMSCPKKRRAASSITISTPEKAKRFFSLRISMS